MGISFLSLALCRHFVVSIPQNKILLSLTITKLCRFAGFAEEIKN
jgi:hypothetical protein